MSSVITTYTMILCALITQRSKDKGIKQQVFFQRSGIATGTWSRMMRGEAHFQIEDLRAACRVLDWTVGELTTTADIKQQQLAKRENVQVASKADLKSEASGAGAIIAAAALAFLLIRLTE